MLNENRVHSCSFVVPFDRKILRNAQKLSKIHKNSQKTTLIQFIQSSGPCFVVSRSYIVYRPWIEVFSYGLFAKQTQLSLYCVQRDAYCENEFVKQSQMINRGTKSQRPTGTERAINNFVPMNLHLQNKPNVTDVVTNINLVKAGGYDDPPGFEGGENKPNQSQFPYKSACKWFIIMALCKKGRNIG